MTHEAPLKNAYDPKNIDVYEYWGQITHIVDGDTIDMEISLGFDITTNKRIRLIGIDSPEIHKVAHSTPEYKAGRAAADYLEELLPVDSWAELRVWITSKREKYGRWLGKIFVDGVDINEKMVSQGHATEVSY